MLLGFKKYPKDSDYVVMMDGDNTYKGQEMYRLLEPLINNFGDVIIGSRMTGKMLDRSFKFQNRVANWAYAFFVRTFYHTNVTDVLSGYFAWKREALEDLAPHITSAGFTLEMEMVTKMLKLGHEVYSVPITYDRRDGYSKIETFKDGIKILNQLFSNIFWSPDTTKHYRR
jgi:glycosyltransferase involved in cell wall biosynthesis